MVQASELNNKTDYIMALKKFLFKVMFSCDFHMGLNLSIYTRDLAIILISLSVDSISLPKINEFIMVKNSPSIDFTVLF